MRIISFHYKDNYLLSGENVPCGVDSTSTNQIGSQMTNVNEDQVEICLKRKFGVASTNATSSIQSQLSNAVTLFLIGKSLKGFLS